MLFFRNVYICKKNESSQVLHKTWYIIIKYIRLTDWKIFSPYFNNYLICIMVYKVILHTLCFNSFFDLTNTLSCHKNKEGHFFKMFWPKHFVTRSGIHSNLDGQYVCIYLQLSYSLRCLVQILKMYQFWSCGICSNSFWTTWICSKTKYAVSIKAKNCFIDDNVNLIYAI